MTSATSRRLLLSFGSLVLLIGAASYFALAGSEQLHTALHELKHREDAIRDTLELGDVERARLMHEEGGERAEAMQRALLEQLDSDEQRRAVATIVAARTPAEATVRAREVARGFESEGGDFEAHGAAVQHSMFLWTLILLAASIIFAIVVAIYIGRSVTRPLAKLREGTERLGSGDLGARVAVDSDDEFGRMAEAFNTMAASLQEHQNRLVEHETLAGIGRVVAGVAHELNNPLGVMLGYVRLLARSAEGVVQADLKIVEEEAVRCQRIVEDLLDVARPTTIASTMVDLRESCAALVERLVRVEGWQTRLSVHGRGTIRGDRAKIEQVVANLVRNAVEAAGPRGSVSVDIAERDGFVEVAVRDSGAGVPPDARARLFEPFYTTKPDGTGLGLAVSQAIARSHRGEITVANVDAGGAVFTLRLPAATLQEAQP